MDVVELELPEAELLLELLFDADDEELLLVPPPLPPLEVAVEMVPPLLLELVAPEIAFAFVELLVSADGPSAERT